ncbi:MAG: pentapeptide repeat-containing protein [Cyanobacteria bacterium P01_F01_bin.143]
MKAKEVLRRYADGERNFRGVNLRGCSFKDKDLSGADFSEADIRRANFTNAKLRGTNFSGAKAGLQRRWVIALMIVAWLMAIISELFYTISLAGLLYVLSEDAELNSSGKIINILVLSVIHLIFFYFTIRRGLVAGISSFAVAGAIAVSGAITIAGAFAGAGAFAVAITVAVAGSIAVAGAVAVTVALAFAIAVAATVTGVFAVTVAAALAFAVTIARVFAVAVTVAVTVAIAFVLLSAYVSWRALKGDERDAWIRSFAIAFAAIGGTSFRGADLTDTNFTGAKLKSTDLRDAILICTRWRDVKKLDCVRPGNSYLNNQQVQQLVITRNGQNQDFSQLINLRGINLAGANLIDANFQGSDLSQANLQQANLTDANLMGANLNFVNLQNANLSRAKLVQTQLSASDLKSATLTGACIEDWGISNSTKLEKINCDYIFLKLPTEHDRDPQRRPSDSKRNFQPGEFIKLTQKIANTVDLIFNDGIDWQVFIETFQGLRVESKTGELPVVQTIENKGDGAFVIRVKVPEDVDEGKYERKFWQQYQPLLQAKDEQIALLSKQTESYHKQIEHIRQENTKLLEIIGTMVEKETSKVNMTFNGPVQTTTGNVEGNQDID